MKKNLQTIFISLLAVISINAQNNCSKYYPMTEGSSFEYTNYSKKGKVDGVTNYTISSIKSLGEATQATLDLIVSDKKGKELFAAAQCHQAKHHAGRRDRP